jgi:hypothetical protein
MWLILCLTPGSSEELTKIITIWSKIMYYYKKTNMVDYLCLWEDDTFLGCNENVDI